MVRISFTISSSAGGSLPDSGIILQMFTHWSPIRSTFFSTCSSAEISRRSVATGDWVASSAIRLWCTSR